MRFQTAEEWMKQKNGSAGTGGGGSSSAGEESSWHYQSAEEWGKQKYTPEILEEKYTRANDWIDQYNKVITGFSDFDKQRNGGYAKDVGGGYGEEIGALLRDFEDFQDYLGVLGFTDATQYTNILRELQKGIDNGNQFMSQFDSEEAYLQYLYNQAEYQRQQGLWTNQDDLLKGAREQKANGGYDALQEQIRQETWAYYSKHGDEYVQDYLDNHTMDYLPAKQEPDYSKYLNPDSPYYSPAKNFLDRQGAEYGQRPAASESYYSQYISPDSPYYNSAKDYMDRQMGEYGQSPKAKPTVKPVDAEERHADAQKVNKLVREKDRIDYVDKYTGKEYKDNFFGQFGGNYTVGRITQDSSLAWNAYLDDPTEENRRYAQTIDQMASEIQQKNRDVLSKERTLSIISKDFANYLPQLADQIKYKAGGAVAGAGAGFAVAVTTGYVPAIGKGVKAGITAASGVYSYQTMRGAAFKSLLEAGVDEETARKAANNEAIISSIIEMGETGLSLALMGGGKAIDAVSGGKVTALTKKVEKIVGKNMATKFMAALFGYLANIGSEWLEEATQESVSIANEENPDVGIWQLTKNSAGTFFDAVTNPDSENRDRVVEAGEGGARLATLMGGWEIGTNAAITKAATSFNANRLYGQNPGALVQTALEVNPESVLAKNLQTKLESGKKLTGSELAKLAGETENSFRDQQRRAISTAVEQRLNEVGETGDVETIATAIAKKVMGEELSVKENHAFKQSSIGDMVLREMSQQKRESPGNNGWRNAAEYARQGNLNVMDALNRAGLSGAADLARANPRGYWRSFQEALKNGASYDQALMQATSETTMKVVGNQIPMGTLLYNIGGDPKKAVSVIGSILNQAGINMTPGELNLLGIIAAEASAYQRDASFQTKVALEMLKGPKEEAWTAASEALWQEATDRAIKHGVANLDLEGKEGQNQQVPELTEVKETIESSEEIDNTEEHDTMDSRGMAMSLRSPKSHILTEEEIQSVLTEARALGIDEKLLRFNQGTQTGFVDGDVCIDIRGDILPDLDGRSARDQMSMRAVLAHEYYGHYLHHPSEYPVGDWRDEFRASYEAAVKAPNLTAEDRAYLMIDAYDRAREARHSLDYDETARRIIFYGYEKD